MIEKWITTFNVMHAGGAILLHKYGCQKTLSVFPSSWKLLRVSNHLLESSLQYQGRVGKDLEACLRLLVPNFGQRE